MSTNTGHHWPTRLADHSDDADRKAARRIALEAFETTAEADLIGALEKEEGAFLPQFCMFSMMASIPGSDLQSDPVAYGMLARAHVDDAETLVLAPHGVLPEQQGQGAGTAVVNALVKAAKEAGEKTIVVFGYPNYYPRFGFRPAAEFGITAPFAKDQPEALQVLVLDESAQVPSGEFRYPEAFGA